MKGSTESTLTNNQRLFDTYHYKRQFIIQITTWLTMAILLTWVVNSFGKWVVSRWDRELLAF